MKAAQAVVDTVKNSERNLILYGRLDEAERMKTGPMMLLTEKRAKSADFSLEDL